MGQIKRYISNKRRAKIAQLTNSNDVPIPDSIRDEILELVPNIDWDSICFASKIHNMSRGSIRKQKASRELIDRPITVRENMEDLFEQVAHLQTSISLLDEKSRIALWSAAGLVGGAAFVENLRVQLQQLSNVTRQAYNLAEVREGNPGSGRKKFAAHVVSVLISAGYNVDASKSGPLYRITELLLTHFKECPKDIASFVESAIRENSSNQV